MQRRWKLRTVLLAAVLVIVGGCRPAPGALAAALDRPGRLIRLADGRALNIRCSGSGAPTVLLESGFGADSRAWSKVQPAVARTTRTCAYDRAGYGFSDPGPLPRDGAAIARDLDQALDRARIAGPFVIVGHSAGGLYARLAAARRPNEVVGLIFLDPTVEQLAPAHIPDADGLGGIRQRLRRCLATSLDAAKLDARDAGWAGCISRSSGPRAAVLGRRPEMWRNQLSELDSIFRETSLETDRIGGILIDVPAYVITASDTAAAAPLIGRDPSVSMWELRHQQLAQRFLTSSQQTVLSSHLLMLDRPEVAIAAIQEMVRASRERRAPTPLPPSEWSAGAQKPAGAADRDSVSKPYASH